MPYRVELIICKPDNTWFIDVMEISHRELGGQEDFDYYSEDYVIEKWKDNYAKHAKKIEDITYVGVYSTKEIEGEELEEDVENDTFNYKKDKKDYDEVSKEVKKNDNGIWDGVDTVEN